VGSGTMYLMWNVVRPNDSPAPARARNKAREPAVPTSSAPAPPPIQTVDSAVAGTLARSSKATHGLTLPAGGASFCFPSPRAEAVAPTPTTTTSRCPTKRPHSRTLEGVADHEGSVHGDEVSTTVADATAKEMHGAIHHDQ
jgi:hypothetical protein